MPTKTLRRPAATPARRTATGAERPPGVRELSARATRDSILKAATKVFAKQGYEGGKVDQISKAAKSYDRMIYYYFGSKEGLYLAVLEAAYSRIRSIEAGLHLEDMAPEAALRTLVAFTFDYQAANPDFIRLVMNENMHRGEYLAQSKTIQRLNVPAIDAVREIYERGVREGVFRPGVDAVALHMAIAAPCFFNVANRHTFGLIFKIDFDDPAATAARRESIVEMIVRFVRC